MSQQVFFVDASVAGADELKSALELSVGEGSKVFVLENNSDAFQQMDAALASLGDVQVDAVHIYAHGAAGSVTLGGRRVDQAALDESAAILDKIGNYLTEDGDILLYSCNTAQGAAGQSFIQRLAALTRADVAASTDVTGSAGNWVLERATGVIEAPVRKPVNFTGNLAPLEGAGIIEADATNVGDKITGSVVNDVIYGYGGEHTMVGGDGNDAYYVRQLGGASAKKTKIVEAANEGSDTVVSQIADLDLSSSSTTEAGNDSMSAIENIVLQASSAMVAQNVKANNYSQTITGNALDNKIVGMGGNDYLDGGDGNDFLDGGDGNLSGTDYGTDRSDTLVGGKGDDQFVVRNVNDVVVEAANQGTDHVYSFIDYTLGANVENLTLLDGTDTEHAADAYGNQLNNELKGNKYANYLWGGAGNDTLYGSKAADEASDTLDGGAGNDLYFVYTDKDKIVDTAGNDTIVSTGDYDLRNAANVEALHLVGDATVATGNSLNNHLMGNESLASTLDGVAGRNTLEGGSKADTFVVRNSGDTIIDAGGDNVVLAHATVNLNAGNFSKAVLNRVELQGDASLSATAKTTVATTLIGNAGNNTLTGGNLGDVLDDGGAGVNSLAGGAGNDYYVVSSENTTIRENKDAGLDTVEAWTRDYALGDNVEHLILKEDDDISAASEGLSRTATGNSLANDIDANDVTTEVVLRGTANAAGERGDTLRGGTGVNHFYTYQQSDELVLQGTSNYIYINYDVEGGSDKTKAQWATYLGLTDADIAAVKYLGAPDTKTRTGITAETSADAPYLVGTEYGDALKAGDGVASTLDGGKGNDTMTGGSKADVFYIDSAQDVVSGGTNTVTDAAGNKVYDTVRATANVDFVATYADANRTVRSRISGDVGSVELLGSAALNVTGSNLSTAPGGYQGAQTALKITGNAGRNQLTGTRYNDTIDAGEGGSAIMRGGAGNDFYYVRNSADQVQGEDANGGDDTVQTYGVNVNLGTTFRNVEHVANMGGAVSMTGAGNGANLTAAEEFTAGAFGDSIDGKGGADTITRGAGADVVYYYGTETVNATGNDEADHADTLILSKTPTAFDNTADRLTNVAKTFGAVSMESGGRADIDLDVSSATHGMTITGNAGNNAVKAGSGNDVIYGGGGSDEIDAGAGDDYAEAVLTTVGDYQTTTGNSTTYNLKGGQGQDTLSFGTGNQTIVFQSHEPDTTSDDKVTTFTQRGLRQLDGTRLVAADSVAVGVQGFEAFDGGAGNDSLDARGLNSAILLAGGAGSDTLIGGAGNDTLVADGGNDTITTGKGQNQIRVTAAAKGSTITVTDYARVGNTEGTVDFINDSELSGWTRSIAKVNADVQIVWTNPDKSSEKVTMRLLNADVADVRFLRPDSGDVTFRVGTGADAAFTGGVFYAEETDANTAWTVATKAEAQKIVGGKLGDTLSDAKGKAAIMGDAGDDAITGIASDTLEGEAGNDTILLKGVSGGDADTVITSVHGGAGNDRIVAESFGGAGTTDLTGGEGDDLIVIKGLEEAGSGSRTIAGGTGDNDTLRFENSGGVSVTSTALENGGTLSFTGIGLDPDKSVTANVTGIEAFEGTAAADNVNLAAYATGVTYRTGGGNDHFTGASVGGNTVIVDGAFTSGTTAAEPLKLDGGSASGDANTLQVELAGASLALGSEADDASKGNMALTHNRQQSGALTNFQKVELASDLNAGASVTVNAHFDVSSAFEVVTGSGADTFTVHGTNGNAMTLNGGAGDDAFILDDLIGSLGYGTTTTLALKGGGGTNSLVMAGANNLAFDQEGRLTTLKKRGGVYKLAATETENGLYLENIQQYVTKADTVRFDIGTSQNGLTSGSLKLASTGNAATFTVYEAVAEHASLEVRGGAGTSDSLAFFPYVPTSPTGGNLLYLTMQSDGSFTAAYADTDDASKAVANITGSGIETFTLGAGRIVTSEPGNTSAVNANVFNAALYAGGLVIYTGVNRDVVTGGKGGDTFYLSTGDDVITLNGGKDRLVLKRAFLAGDGRGGSITTIKGKFTATAGDEEMLDDADLTGNGYSRTVSSNTTLGSKKGIKVVYHNQADGDSTAKDIVLLFEDNKPGDISNYIMTSTETLVLNKANYEGWTGEILTGAVTTLIKVDNADAKIGDVTLTGNTNLASVDFGASAGSFVYTDDGEAHAQTVTGTNAAKAAKGKWDNMITVNGGLSSTVEANAEPDAVLAAVEKGAVSITGGKGRDQVVIAGGAIGKANLADDTFEMAGYTISTGDGDDDIRVEGGVNSGELKIFAGKGNDTITVSAIADGAVSVEDNDGDNDITVYSITGGSVTLDGGAAKTTITVTSGISGGKVLMYGDEGVNAFTMGAVSGDGTKVLARGYKNSTNTYAIENAAAKTVISLQGDGYYYDPGTTTDTLKFTGTANGVTARFTGEILQSGLEETAWVDADKATIGLSGVESVMGTAQKDTFTLEGFTGSALTITGNGGGDSIDATAWNGSGTYMKNTGTAAQPELVQTPLTQQVTVNFTGGGNTIAVGKVDAQDSSSNKKSKLTVVGSADKKTDTLVIDGGGAGASPVNFKLNTSGQLTGAGFTNSGELQAGSLYIGSAASYVATSNIYSYTVNSSANTVNALDASAYKGAVTLSATGTGTNVFSGGGNSATQMLGGEGTDQFYLTGAAGLVDGGAQGSNQRDVVNLSYLAANGIFTLTDVAQSGAVSLSGGVTATLKNIEELRILRGQNLTLNAAQAGSITVSLFEVQGSSSAAKSTLTLTSALAGKTITVDNFKLGVDSIAGGTLTNTVVQDGNTTATYDVDGKTVTVNLMHAQDHSRDAAGVEVNLPGGVGFFGSTHADTVTAVLSSVGYASFVDLQGNADADGEETLTVKLGNYAPFKYGKSTLKSSGTMAEGARSVLVVDNAGFDDGVGAALAFKNTGGTATLSSITLTEGGNGHTAELETSGFTAYRGTTAADAVSVTGGSLVYETNGGADSVKATSSADTITVNGLTGGTSIDVGSGDDVIYVESVAGDAGSAAASLKGTAGQTILSFAKSADAVAMKMDSMSGSSSPSAIIEAGGKSVAAMLSGITKFEGSGQADTFNVSSLAAGMVLDGGEGGADKFAIKGLAAKSITATVKSGAEHGTLSFAGATEAVELTLGSENKAKIGNNTATLTLGNIDQFAGSATAANTFTVDDLTAALSITGGAGYDTFTLRNLSAAVSIHGGAGDNHNPQNNYNSLTVNGLEAGAALTYAGGESRDIVSITGDVDAAATFTLDGGGGGDFLTLEGKALSIKTEGGTLAGSVADKTGQTFTNFETITADSVTAAENFQKDAGIVYQFNLSEGATFTQGVSFAGDSGAFYLYGTGADNSSNLSFNLGDISFAGNEAEFVVAGGAGDDLVQLGVITGAEREGSNSKNWLSIYGDDREGADQSSADTLSFNGVATDTVLAVSLSGGAGGDYMAAITYGEGVAQYVGIEGFEYIQGHAGKDTFTLESVAGGMTLDGGEGGVADTFNVTALADDSNATGSVTLISGNDGSTTGTLNFSSLTASITVDEDTYTRKNTAFTVQGNTVEATATYALEDHDVTRTNTFNTTNIDSIVGTADADTFNVSSLADGMSLDGGTGGADKFNIKAFAADSITATVKSGAAGGTLSFASSSYANLLFGEGEVIEEAEVFDGMRIHHATLSLKNISTFVGGKHDSTFYVGKLANATYTLKGNSRWDKVNFQQAVSGVTATLTGTSEAATLSANGSTLTLVDIDEICGSGHNDIFNVGTLESGEYTLDGYEGSDVVSFADKTGAAGVTATLNMYEEDFTVYTKLTVGEGVGAPVLTLSCIEKIEGTANVDAFTLDNLSAGMSLDGGSGGADVFNVKQLVNAGATDGTFSVSSGGAGGTLNFADMTADVTKGDVTFTLSEAEFTLADNSVTVQATSLCPGKNGKVTKNVVSFSKIGAIAGSSEKANTFRVGELGNVAFSLSGGTATDTVSLKDKDGPCIASLETTSDGDKLSVTGGPTLTLAVIEQIQGHVGADTIMVGNLTSGSYTLNGNGGTDVVSFADKTGGDGISATLEGDTLTFGSNNAASVTLTNGFNDIRGTAKADTFNLGELTKYWKVNGSSGAGDQLADNFTVTTVAAGKTVTLISGAAGGSLTLNGEAAHTLTVTTAGTVTTAAFGEGKGSLTLQNISAITDTSNAASTFDLRSAGTVITSVTGGTESDTYRLNKANGAVTTVTDTDKTKADTIELFGFTTAGAASELAFTTEGTGEDTKYIFTNLKFSYSADGKLTVKNGENTYLSFNIGTGDPAAGGDTLKIMDQAGTGSLFADLGGDNALWACTGFDLSGFKGTTAIAENTVKFTYSGNKLSLSA